MPGLSSNNEIIWEYLDQNESEFLYHEIFVNQAYFNGISISSGDLVVDAGANIGLFSLYCLSKFKDIRLCAFEPITPVYEVLRRNLAVYRQKDPTHGPNMTLFNSALGAKNEKQQKFYYFPSSPGESTRHIKERSLQKSRIQQLIRNSSDRIFQDMFSSQSNFDSNKRKMADPSAESVDPNLQDDVELYYADVFTLPTIMSKTYGDKWMIDLLKVCSFA
jgi:FkbM family methyltransferase